MTCARLPVLLGLDTELEVSQVVAHDEHGDGVTLHPLQVRGLGLGLGFGLGFGLGLGLGLGFGLG